MARAESDADREKLEQRVAAAERAVEHARRGAVSAGMKTGDAEREASALDRREP
jgi:hypothetical protein